MQKIKSPSPVTSVSFSHDSSASKGYLAIGGFRAPTQIFRVRDWQRVKVLEGQRTHHVAFAPERTA